MAAIRKAGASDEAAVLALIRRAYAKYVPRIGREPAPMTGDYGAAIEAGRCWVLDGAGRLSGVLVMRPKDGGWFVDTVGVDPADQGKGVGRALMEFAEAEALRNGFGAVRLYTNAKMAENMPFYRGLGYEIAERRVEDGFDRVFFLKRLGT
ncbi:MAG: GNAT family N-acetyltransferase [Rhodospirillales bacterium]